MKIFIHIVNFIFTFCIIITIGVKKVDSKELKTTLEVGRYQLFQGTYTSFDLKNNRKDESVGIFLLDTMTGKVKLYSNILGKNGNIFEGWVLIPQTLKSQQVIKKSSNLK